VDPVVRILYVVFWITVALLEGALVFLDDPAVNAVLMVALVLCSGLIALYEFRLNPQPMAARGGWSGRQLFYAVVFTISFFLSFHIHSHGHLLGYVYEAVQCRRCADSR
jgi:hypothetical protein